MKHDLLEVEQQVVLCENIMFILVTLHEIITFLKKRV